MQLEQMAKLRQLTIQILINGVKALLELLLGQLADGVMSGVVIDIWEQHRLREWRTDVFSRTAVAVSTSTNFVVERAVDSILLRTKDVGLRSGSPISDK
jgi:hypothetical protein